MQEQNESKNGKATEWFRWVAKDLRAYGVTFYVLLALFSMWYVTINLNRGTAQNTIQMQMIGAIILLGMAGLYLGYKKKITYENLLLMIILLGCIMRIGYCAYNDVFERAHDLWNFDDYEAAGKGTYLMGLILYKKLPDSYAHQHYHQPFSYLASALGSLLVKPFLKDTSTWMLGSAGKIANGFASCAVLIMTPKLCKEIKLSKTATVISTLLVATFPGFFLIAGRIGEDAYSCLFAIACILYTVKWEKDHSWKNTILLAFFFGFGVNTNLTCCLPTVYTIFVVVKSFLKEKELRKEIIYKGEVFLAISLPVGLWFYIRNYCLFRMPFTYTFPQEVGGPLYTGDKTVWERFIPFHFQNIKDTPFAHAYADYNLPTYMLKTELFGEFEYANVTTFIPYVLLYLNLFITVLAFVMMVGKLVRRKFNHNRLSIYIMTAVYFLFTVYSYFTYPYGCSMDARYFMIYTLLKCMFVGILVADLSNCAKSTVLWKKVVGSALYFMTAAACLIFAATACSMFCVIV